MLKRIGPSTAHCIARSLIVCTCQAQPTLRFSSTSSSPLTSSSTTLSKSATPKTSTATSSSSSSSSSSTRATLGPPIPNTNQVTQDPERAKKNLLQRNSPLPVEVIDEIVRLGKEVVGLKLELQNVRERRNLLSKANKKTIPSRGREMDLEKEREEAKEVKLLLKSLEPRLTQAQGRLQELGLQIPNRSHPSSPIGDESKAKIIRSLGPPIETSAEREELSRDHARIMNAGGGEGAEGLDWTDFTKASLISGNSWPLLKKAGAKLELALTQYALSIALKNKYELVLPPDVVRSEIAERCGFQPRDQGQAQQTYFLGDGRTSSEKDSCLVGTAEIPLVAMHAGQTYRAEDLPKRIVGLGRAFRAEAGARGKDSKGLYRVHQFSKIEFVVVSADDQSPRMFDELVRLQIEILSGLGLSLRVLEMPTEELGVSAHRKFDIEAWMPGRGTWGELSSASNCTDWQARRLLIRYRPPAGGSLTKAIGVEARLEREKKELEDLNIPTPAALEATAFYPSLFKEKSHRITTASGNVWCHTLNATAAAIPRLIVAIIENGVVLDSQGTVERVRLPLVLKRWWLEGGSEEDERIEWAKEGEPLRLDPHQSTVEKSCSSTLRDGSAAIE